MPSPADGDGASSVLDIKAEGLPRRGPLIQEISSVEYEGVPNSEDISEAPTAKLPKLDDIVSQSEDSKNEGDNNMLSTCLSILSTILIYGNTNRSAEEEAALRDMLPSLQAIATQAGFEDHAEMAMNLAIAIMTRDQTVISNMKASIIPSESDVVFTAYCEGVVRDYIIHEHPSMRALGTKSIISHMTKVNKVF